MRQAPSNWTYLCYSASILGLDAYVLLPIFLWLPQLNSLLLFLTCLLFIIFFAVLNYFGYTPKVALDRSLDFLVGGQFHRERPHFFSDYKGGNE